MCPTRSPVLLITEQFALRKERHVGYFGFAKRFFLSDGTEPATTSTEESHAGAAAYSILPK